ncbi:hypothetical protein PR048_010236 [Dryococelus australis]|uniref:Uncharacterized protein n=1 Tax=Dryococelus australis TaxID=614101 RepID=A0ABQ9I2B4_9NEOP|nr:hypothetical protein PR048_010236 [Dryococelus australis]
MRGGISRMCIADVSISTGVHLGEEVETKEPVDSTTVRREVETNIETGTEDKLILRPLHHVASTNRMGLDANLLINLPTNLTNSESVRIGEVIQRRMAVIIATRMLSCICHDHLTGVAESIVKTQRKFTSLDKHPLKTRVIFAGQRSYIFDSRKQPIPPPPQTSKGSDVNEAELKEEVLNFIKKKFILAAEHRRKHAKLSRKSTLVVGQLVLARALPISNSPLEFESSVLPLLHLAGNRLGGKQVFQPLHHDLRDFLSNTGPYRKRQSLVPLEYYAMAVCCKFESQDLKDQFYDVIVFEEYRRECHCDSFIKCLCEGMPVRQPIKGVVWGELFDTPVFNQVIARNGSVRPAPGEGLSGSPRDGSSSPLALSSLGTGARRRSVAAAPCAVGHPDYRLFTIKKKDGRHFGDPFYRVWPRPTIPLISSLIEWHPAARVKLAPGNTSFAMSECSNSHYGRPRSFKAHRYLRSFSISAG